MKEINVGIDLGTTYSAVAVFDSASGSVKILKNHLEEETTPSVVCIENGNVLIGVEAKDEQAAGNVGVAAFYKNMMGNDDLKPYLDGREYTAEQLSGIFLSKLKESVEGANNVKIGGAVITVPAYFNEAQRQATIRAGEAAGLKVLKIINEPTAAIIAYGLTGIGKRNVMVYDLGGGTFDVTIAKIDGANVQVIATNGNHQLGGKDWDNALVEMVTSQFENDYEIRLAEYPEAYNGLLVQCERAKKQLTAIPSTTISITCSGYKGRYTVTREEFDAKTAPYLNETLTLSENCFSEIGGGFGWHSIDEVVLVGGSTRMPQVSELITKVFGKPPKIIGNKVDTIVATGAAMQASLCTSGTITLNLRSFGVKTSANGGSAQATLTLSNDNIKDVTSHSLGMLAFAKDGGDIVNSIIIKKNSLTGVPYGRQYNFKGEKLEVYVLQGELTSPYECTLLYKYIVTGMDKNAKNEFTINFQYNQNGVVEVTGNLKNGAALAVQKTIVDESIEEIIARLKREREEAQSRMRSLDVTFAIDTSGSMAGSGIREAKKSITKFIEKLDLKYARVSVISFDSNYRWICRNDKSAGSINSAVERLSADGGTSADPFELYLSDVNLSVDEQRVIIALTDGEWFYPDEAIRNADNLKSRGVIIYAVGVDGANYSFLEKIASPGGAKKIDLSQLTKTFSDIASSIANEQ